MADIEGERDTRLEDEAEPSIDSKAKTNANANGHDDDQLSDLPEEAEEELPEMTDEDEGKDEDDQPYLPEVERKRPDLPEVDQDGTMEMNGETEGLNGTDEKKKKKKSEEGERKGKKKRKKGDKKASFSSRDELYGEKKGPRVRSFDASQMKRKFDKPKAPQTISTECKLCGKQVFQMEKIVAEKASWHKNCFRCKECNKALTLDTYSSHEGIMYCKPHFKNLFQPKAVIVDPEEAHRERMARRPKLIIAESKPEVLPDDVVRATSKPDYGLEELQTTDLKQRFSMFESLTQESQKPKLEPANVRRSASLMNKAAKFLQDDEDYGVDNDELGEYDEEDEEEEDEDEEEEEGEEEEVEYDENGDVIEKAPKVPKTKTKKKQRPMSFSGVGDLQTAFEKKTRREKMSQQRKEELSKFRQMLCAGKNISLKEKFESGVFDEDERATNGHTKEAVKIEGRPAARSLRERFEKGEFSQEDGENSERAEVQKVFRDAETASKARNLFKQIDSSVQEGEVSPREKLIPASERRKSRLLQSGSTDLQEEDEDEEEEEEEELSNKNLASKFMFFATYEARQKKEIEKKRKPFQLERAKVVDALIRAKPMVPKSCMAINCAVCRIRGWDGQTEEESQNADSTVNVDCPNTQNILKMFRKMELQDDDDYQNGPRPLKEFTPPPEDYEGESDDEECSEEEEYSDEEEEEEEDEDEEERERPRVPKYKDELLEMNNSSQSAKKAANIRAKFEKWENEETRQNEINKSFKEDEEEMPSIDTARNLRAMFESKAKEETPLKKAPAKVNRFV